MNIEYLHAVISTFSFHWKEKNSAFKLTNVTSFFCANQHTKLNLNLKNQISHLGSYISTKYITVFFLWQWYSLGQLGLSNFFIISSLVWIKITLDKYKSISWESISKVTLSYCPWNWLMYISKRSLKMSSQQKHRLLVDWLNNNALK